MTDRQRILSYLAIYRERFPEEAGSTELFAGYMAETEDGNLYNRKNFNGHITASAFIVDTDKLELLLLRHKSLSKWLQPGGHVEGDITLLASAMREVEEETGISAAQLRNIPLVADSDAPFDIDSHFIPPNPRKAEDGHYHHDMRYLFAYSGDGLHDHNPDEATGLRWVPFAELENDAIFGTVVKKIAKFLSL